MHGDARRDATGSVLKDRRPVVVFLCTANACRSQLAEALARRVLPASVRVLSAGTRPKTVDPRTETVLRELGIAIDGQRSKHIDELGLESAELMITLCDDAAESCPTFPARRREHWGLPDPAGASGSEDIVLARFREVRDEILRRILALAPSLAPQPAFGVIGGSGFYDLPGLRDASLYWPQTPYGAPSAPLLEGWIGENRVVFLARHGEGHALLPSEIEARANIHALKSAGVRRLISVSAVGSLREEIAPGRFVLPDQFLDRTVARPSTFFGDGVVAHVALADPVCPALHAAVHAVLEVRGESPHPRATYVCIEGPQFSTRAESRTYRTLGADVVGMTALPEARLAREAEICYASLAIATDYDSWREEGRVEAADALAVLGRCVSRARYAVQQVLAARELDACTCGRALDPALVTPREKIDLRAQARLYPILERRLGMGRSGEQEER